MKKAEKNLRLPRRPAARKTFRHGDLRQALLQAGLDLARAGGPSAVALREATRRAGVVPNAAYRHFASQNDLLQAVRSASLAALAAAMEAELGRIRPGRDRAAYARRSLRAVGSAYLIFARNEPGLFRTAFSVPPPEPAAHNPANAGPGGLNPFQLLGSALDRMVAGGILSPARRPGAEFLAWSAVHGLALLLLDGPLQAMPHPPAHLLGRRVLDMVERGIA